MHVCTWGPSHRRFRWCRKSLGFWRRHQHREGWARVFRRETVSSTWHQAVESSGTHGSVRGLEACQPGGAFVCGSTAAVPTSSMFCGFLKNPHSCELHTRASRNLENRPLSSLYEIRRAHGPGQLIGWCTGWQLPWLCAAAVHRRSTGVDARPVLSERPLLAWYKASTGLPREEFCRITGYMYSMMCASRPLPPNLRHNTSNTRRGFPKQGYK